MENYTLIGFGDFSHGDNEYWKYAIGMLRTAKKVGVVFVEDSLEHTENIMSDSQLQIGKGYESRDNVSWGPLWRYCIKTWDSPIYLEFIQYIRANKIKIVGVDNQTLVRDEEMANRIIAQHDPNRTNFFFGASGHIANRDITEKYETQGGLYPAPRAGKLLKQHFGKKYFIILTAARIGQIRFSSVCIGANCEERQFGAGFTYLDIKHRIAKGKVLKCRKSTKLVEYSDAYFSDLAKQGEVRFGGGDSIIVFDKCEPLGLTKN
jgi:hypothetical protein